MTPPEPIIEQTDDVNRPIIILQSNGVELRARITPKKSDRNVTAEWIKPDVLANRLVHAPHVAAFAAYPTSLYYRDGVLQPKAIPRIASRMLRDFSLLHELKENGYDHVSRMRELIVLEFESLPHSEILCDESFKKEKSALRKRMKAGEINHLEYQRLLETPVSLNKNYHAAVGRAQMRFMDECKAKSLPPFNIDDLDILSEYALTNMPVEELWERYAGIKRL